MIVGKFFVDAGGVASALPPEIWEITAERPDGLVLLARHDNPDDGPTGETRLVRIESLCGMGLSPDREMLRSRWDSAAKVARGYEARLMRMAGLAA